ncbi:sigma-70 family RNA polymerase sigma factor [Serratia marcescens]|uniref:Sigma-70 family RNA polymerase sigma factor n=1 Tax=Serratia marcescens TaxID=615 RepID=A0ABD5BEQ8_SERMA|nr:MULTISPECIES: sigma-70 family RNA polymerase sigma factor [Gammaproteobacteria]AUU08216.1 RNA polymerase subunit sigma-24 [Serratia marcescens]MCM8683894.1 sigma-70 family RNA polymerase sigma factor [Pseudomonas aeruginosa]MCM8718397.1 sigma-70 family RNA polymerase sigma factor [Pseudomonas aeruginosa]MCP2644779.1 sigma-70 family RNA polymerase sigma factor [Pseudomonas aeruginosa]MCZ6931006.1 RNA polymerase subunit sigma-24 [Serratia marcescens]
MRRHFLTYYDALRKRLKYRLGSEDLANDVLHETWLRIEQRDEEQQIQNPQAYLYRTALNVAYDRQNSGPRLLQVDEIDALLQLEDETQDPVRIVNARNEIHELQRILHQLPWRQHQILVASRLEGIAHREIAQRFHISTRMVEKELRAALNFCAKSMQRNVIQRFGPGAGKSSK